MIADKILIVDDSPVDLEYLRNILHSAGKKVMTATNGEDAYRVAKSERPDMIFMDIIMDGTDGFSACRSITSDRDTSDIPVVFVSSKNQKADRVWGELQGGRGMISKPYTEEQILNYLGAR